MDYTNGLPSNEDRIAALERELAEAHSKNAKLRELLQRVDRDSELHQTENFTDYYTAHIDAGTMANIRAAIDGSKEPILFGDREEWVK